MGGLEPDPASIVRITEEISYADGSAGWTTLGASTAFFAWLEPGAARNLIPGRPYGASTRIGSSTPGTELACAAAAVRPRPERVAGAAELFVNPLENSPHHAGPLWRFPLFANLSVTSVGFPLAVARRALDEITPTRQGPRWL